MRASLLGWEILSKLSSSLGLTFTVYVTQEHPDRDTLGKVWGKGLELHALS